jgi:hypothetical protein
LRGNGQKFDKGDHDGVTPEFVFGYGSLVGGVGGGRFRAGRRWSTDGFVADLRGFRRTWGVAMDNRRDLPGYKYYTDSRGLRPEVFVAFLDVRPVAEAGAAVNGLCLPVDAAGLAALDARERNYRRIDITDQVDLSDARAVRVRVWTYVGSDPGRERLQRGVEAGTAVIDAHYLEGVRDGFAGLGAAEHRACAGSLEPGGLPVVPLERHAL